MNEYARIAPPPPPPPSGWLPYRGAPALAPQVPPVHVAAPYASPPSAPRRRGRRGWVAVTSVVALGASVLGVVELTRDHGASGGSPFAAAVEGTQAQKSARIDITVEADGLPAPLVTTAEVDLESGASRLTVDLSSLAGLGSSSGRSSSRGSSSLTELAPGPVEVVTKGSVAYLKLGGLAELMGGNAKWLKIDASAIPSSGTTATDAPGIAPDTTALLELLREQADSFTEVGRARVRDVDTTHYTAVIDVARLAREQAASLDDPSIASELDELDGTAATVDVWVDDDDLVRKVVVRGDATGNSATVTIELYDFGTSIDVAIPADADTIDLTALIGTR